MTRLALTSLLVLAVALGVLLLASRGDHGTALTGAAGPTAGEAIEATRPASLAPVPSPESSTGASGAARGADVSPAERRALSAGTDPEVNEATHASLVVRAVRAGDRAPFAGEVVRLRPSSSRGDDRSAGRDFDATTDAAGIARFDELAPGRYRLLSPRSTARGVELEAGEVEQVELSIEAGLEVHGQVVDALGNGVPGAEVLLSERWNGARVAVAGVADAAGRFSLADVTTSSFVSARAPGLAASRQLVPRGAVGERMEVVLTLVATGARVAGTVTDSGDRPVADAVVLIGEAPGAWESRGGLDTLAPAPVRLVTGPTGSFTTAEATPGSSLLRVRLAGFAPYEAPLDVPAGGVDGLLVRLAPPARIVGLVVDDQGAAVPIAEVECTQPGAWREPARTNADAEGRFQLDDLAAGEAALDIKHPLRGRARATLTLVAGGTVEWRAQLQPTPAIHGRLTHADGTPAAGYNLIAMEFSAGRSMASQSEADGTFRLPHLEPVAHHVTVYDPRTRRDFPVLTLEGVLPQEAPLELVLAPERADVGRIVATVVAPDGAPVQGARMTVWHGVQKLWREVDAAAATGRVIVERVPAGVVQLGVQAPGYGTRQLGQREIEAGGELDLGEVRFEAVGTITGTVRGIDDARVAALELHLVPRSKDASWTAARVVEGRLEADPLPAGHWRLCVRGRGVCYRELELEVRAGEQTEVDLELSACGEQRVRITSADPFVYSPWAALTGPAGVTVWTGSPLRREGAAFVADVAAPPGTYTFTAGMSPERRTSCSLVFTGATDDGEIELVLP